ncbi:hypothetical protein LWP59_01515 [Amycolatopsis acidiphila]|uniref:Uncharacterized protein n=1 Tax=Amycolatopsis acidiphila TaxID=715473 RepID=A0A558AN01_9PSEU|nr:hypothetical protein [Amycolatopsis acidiphila]TVT25646.1 hypothetical protein FNH06_02260 [Amycolatopsis acidiphila]UIJ60402.1 hypothetical protein LWP59_01515 [Amycolatopsis acidiphila]GHG90382.1 hypothetical protein GCM10017788_65660 [Amycolatopsis acidiphila]
MESAAMRYKEIVGLAASAADELRAWELRRVQELESEILAAEQAVAEAAQREQRTAQVAHNWWRMAADNVSRLTWLELAEGPTPAANARAAWLDRYLNELKPMYQELVDSVLSLGWRARR